MFYTWSVDWPKDQAPKVCGWGHLYGFRVRVNWLLRFQWILGNWLLLVETSHILSQWKKPGLTLVYQLSLEWGSGPWNYTMWGQALRTPFLFSAFSEYLAESGTWLNGLWQDGVLSWSTIHMLCVLGQDICIFLTWAQRPVYMSFLKGLPGITIKFCTFFVKGVHFVTNCFVEKLLYPHFLATPLKILSVEYDHLSVMKLIRMLRDSSSLPSGGNCRKSRKCSTSGSLFKTAGCSIQMVQY